MSNSRTDNKQRIEQVVLLAVTSAVLVVLLAYVILNIKPLWDGFKQSWQIMVNNVTHPPPLGELAPLLNIFVPMVLVAVLIWKVRQFRKWVWDTIGEGASLQHSSHRFILPFILALPFLAFVLLAGVSKSVPPVVQFSLVAISPTLGGLVLSAAANSRGKIKNKARNELISVAQKLIAATVLLIVFTSLFFTSDLFGSANPTSFDISWVGFFRWAFFWGAVWSFYTGTFLFLLGISDLLLALRYLKR